MLFRGEVGTEGGLRRFKLEISITGGDVVGMRAGLGPRRKGGRIYAAALLVDSVERRAGCEVLSVGRVGRGRSSRLSSLPL